MSNKIVDVILLILSVALIIFFKLILFFTVVATLFYFGKKAKADDAPNELPPSIIKCVTDMECHIAAKKLCDDGNTYWCKVDKATERGAYDKVDWETDKNNNGWPDWMEESGID